MAPKASGALVPRGKREVLGSTEAAKLKPADQRPSTSRALVIRNGKYGSAGTGELIKLNNKIVGQEKLELLAAEKANERIEKLKTAMREAFDMSIFIRIADSQLDFYLSRITDLRDHRFLHQEMLLEMESRATYNARGVREDNTKDPEVVASVFSYFVHNAYVLAAGWRLANDVVLDLARRGITDAQTLKSKLQADDSIHQSLIDLYDVLENISILQLGVVRTLATASEHFGPYFERDGEGNLTFDTTNKLKDMYKSYVDSLIIELLIPEPRWPIHVVLALLKESVDERSKEAERFPRKMWDAVGDFANTCRLLDMIEGLLIGLPDLPRRPFEPLQKFRQTHMNAMLAVSAISEYVPMVNPFNKLQQKGMVEELWRRVDHTYKVNTGVNVETLWGLNNSRSVQPFWFGYQKTSEELKLQGKKGKALIKAADDEFADMPDLLTVSDSSEVVDDGDDSDEDGSEYESDEYDTDDEEIIRDMFRAAMDDASANPELVDRSTKAPDEAKGNGFLRALRHLKGRLFSADPALTTDSKPRKDFSAKSAKPTRVPVDPLSKKATVEDADDEEEPTKKKKKKKPKKKKKKKTGASAGAGEQAGNDEEDEEDEEPGPLPTIPQATPSAAPTTPTKSAKKAEVKASPKGPEQASSSVYHGPAFPSSASLAQSAHSYVKQEGLLDTLKAKVKSRPEPGSVPVPPPSKAKGKKKEEDEKPSIFKRAVTIVSKKTKACLDKLVKLGDDPSQWKGSMKWEVFVKAMADIGFTIDNSTAGSSVRFDPKNPRDKSITIHKPHPDSTLTPIMIKKIGRRLQDRFDWTEDQFITN